VLKNSPVADPETFRDQNTPHLAAKSWSNLGIKPAVSNGKDHRPAFFNRLAHYRPHHRAGQIEFSESGTLCASGIRSPIGACVGASAAPLQFGSVPIPRTRLIGREAERAAARSLLLEEAVPLLTLTGMGGVGKTRLALAIAADVREHFPDSVVWIDLAPLQDPALVAATVASALGFVPRPNHPVVAELARHLRPFQVLLLIDNCEHLASAVADLVAGLLAACPAVQILATSRAALNIRGEHHLPVHPLLVPPPEVSALAVVAEHAAVQLFAERARAVRPAFRLDDNNAATVAALCRYLDGLPLAIELAAARMTLLSPVVLLAQMADRLRLLRGGARDAPPRQRTMRDTIAWSYGLLTPAEQTVFRRLAVFVGGFALDAAAAVSHMPSDAGIDVLDGLTSLADHHLVRPVDELTSEPRFSMLETVRAFALEQLAASGEANGIRGRHAAWFLQLAEASEMATPGGPQQAIWLTRLEGDLPNLRDALGWLEETGDSEAMMRLAGALGGFWFWRSHRREGAGWLERALALADSTPTVGRAKALKVLGFQGMEQGSVRAADYAAESVAVWMALGDTWRAAEARLALGQILEYRAEYERAIPMLEASAREWDAMGDSGRVALALYFLGQAALDHEDGPRAVALFEEARDRFSQSSYAWGDSASLHQLGEVAAMRGDVMAAATYYAKSLDGTGSRENLVGKLVATARLAAVGGHAEAAARLFGAAAALADTIGYVRRRPEQERLERDAAVAQAALGDAGFAATRTAGRELSAEQAVAEALAVLAALGAPAAPGTAGDLDGPTPMGMAAKQRLPAPDARTVLTYREQEVLALLCQRLTDAEIGDRLFLSKRTVEHHVSSILGKLGVANRRQAAAFAARYHLV
jgi:predicted ATPase/DNA-binding CsgD family transcriptional regulator